MMPRVKLADLALLDGPAMLPSTVRAHAKNFANHCSAQLDMDQKIHWEDDDPLAEESIINIYMILPKISRNNRRMKFGLKMKPEI
jgi:hypothetical protein